LKDLKRQYREGFNQLKELKSEAKFHQSAIDSGKTQLVADFEVWYEETFTAPGADKSRAAQISTPNNNASAKKGDKSPMKLYRDPAMDED
jgi:hypothetical protein